MAWTALRAWSEVGAYSAAALAAGIVHLAEVHLVDARAGALARDLTGSRFDTLPDLAIPLPPPVQGAIAAYYLLAFLAFLAWTPGLVAATGDVRLLKRTLLCYPLLYLLALPGFLFFPAQNPYTRAGEPSPFDTIHPQLEEVYYLLTTRDNTIPSLHVAFTLTLAAALWRAWPLWRPAIAAHATLLTASVVLARVHYVADVAAGALLAWLAWRASEQLLDGRLGRAMDAGSDKLRARVMPTRAPAPPPRARRTDDPPP